MELRHLRYFVAVAEDLSFRKAAERLHVSRPALSKQIKELENEISARLLERNTVSVALTPAGILFLEDAQQILAQVERAVERAAEAQAAPPAKLRIGSVGPIATEFLPQALKSFRRQCPEARISFVETPPTDQLEALGRGQIDIGFTYNNGGPPLGNFARHCVIRSRYALALDSQHPWAQRASVALDELAEIPLLAMGKDSNSIHRDHMLRMCADEGFKPRRVRQVETFDSLLNLLAADQGLSLLPVVLDLVSRGIVFVPLTTVSADTGFRMWAIWKKDRPSPLVEQFIKILAAKSEAH